MRVCIVAEYYPRADDPVLGIWAHEQAKAARDAGADVRVVVLHRPIPPLDTPKRELPAATRRLLAQPRRATIDGIDVTYARYLAPPRPRSYGAWGAWAQAATARALRGLRKDGFAFDLVHAHNAVPAGDAVRRAKPGVPLVVSVHGGDVFYTAPKARGGEASVRATFGAATLVLANSAGIESQARALGARRTAIVRLGTDIPTSTPPVATEPTLTTVGHLVARKRHADVIRAMWLLRDRHPRLRYVVVGDGPERDRLATLARDLGVADRVDLVGQLPHAAALDRSRRAHVFVMPSTDEAFGVAYVEAMAAGIPAIGSLGEPGPLEIATAGGGISLVPPADIEALADAIDLLLSDPHRLHIAATAARATVERSFTWARCGTATVAAYETALAAPGATT